VNWARFVELADHWPRGPRAAVTNDDVAVEILEHGEPRPAPATVEDQAHLLIEPVDEETRLADVRQRRAVHLAALAIAVFGGWLIIYTTRYGMFTHGDSGAYVGMAENFRHGRGLTMPFDLATDRFSPVEVYRFGGAVPSTHFPPLYSIFLAIFAAGRSIWDGARTIAVIVMVVNLYLATVLTMRMLPARRQWVALAVPFVIAIPLGNPPGWIIQDATVGSEPLFHAWWLGAFLALSYWLERRRPGALRIAVGLTAAALLTRHVGFFCVFVLAGTVFLALRGSIGSRLAARRAALLGGISVVPWAAVMFWGHLAGGDEGGGLRELVVHPMGGTKDALLRVITTWFLPPRWTDAARNLALLAIVAILAVMLVQLRHCGAVGMPLTSRAIAARPGGATLLMVLAAIPLYIATVLLSRTFFDASIPIDDRIFSPVRPMLAMVLIVTIGWVTVHMRTALAAAVVAAITFAIVHPHFDRQRAFVQHLADTDQGKPFPELDIVRASAPGTLVVSSSPDVVFAVAGHPAVMTPKHNVVVADRPNRCYDRDVAEVVELLRQHGGYVYLTVAASLYGNSTDAIELSRSLNLRLVAQGPAGELYWVDAVPGAPAAVHLPCSAPH
jgi:hypothetical protein